MAVSRDPILGSDSGVTALLTKINNDMTELFTIALEVENARDGESTLLAQINTLQASITALTAGSGCPVSSNDTSAGYLNGKLVYPHDTIQREEKSDGGDETMEVTVGTDLPRRLSFMFGG